MKRPATLLFLLLASLAAPLVSAAGQAPPRTTLKPIGECMDPARIHEWYVIDAQTMIVRNGPNRFLIRTQHQCPRLGMYGDGLHFRPSPDKQVTLLRICGDVGETVSSRAQPPCAIKSVKRIDKAEFDTMKAHALRKGSGAEPNQPAKP